MTTISPNTAHHVLWMFDRGGYPPGGFVKALLSAIAKADPENREKLRGVYPEYVEAYELAAETETGIEVLRGIVEIGVLS